ncbi:MAG: hypothetical protein Q9169_006065 [Polycauliona sp. 2 TL-2023]
MPTFQRSRSKTPDRSQETSKIESLVPNLSSPSMSPIPMYRVKLIWIGLFAILRSGTVARVADVFSEDPGLLAVTVATDFVPELTASEPVASSTTDSTASDPVSSSSTSTLPTISSTPTIDTDPTPKKSIQWCGSRGMRPCPLGLQCNYPLRAKLGFVQDLAGQCETPGKPM